MASILRVNTLTDASSNNSVPMATVASGSAKAWLEGSPAAALADSFNISGGTDNGTGDYSYAYSNNMNGTNYSITDSCHSSGLSATDNGSQATNGFKLQIFQRGNSTLGSAIDNVNYGSIHGDLA